MLEPGRSHSAPAYQPSGVGPLRDPSGGVGKLFQWATDAGLLMLLFVAPLFMGGRHPWGQFAFQALVFATTVLWLVGKAMAERSSLQYSNSTWLLLAGIVLLLMQLVPLPATFIQLASPGIQALLPVWNGSSDGGIRWHTISLAPYETRQSLIVYLAYCLLFLITVDHIRSLADARRILSWMALASAAMALLGIVQYLFSNGRFLWIYAHPTRETFHMACGPFANPNHFAHFVVMGIGPGLWIILQHARGPSTRVACRKPESIMAAGSLAALCISSVAVGLSLSRGGMAMLAVAIVTFGVLVCKFELLERRLAVSLVMMATVCAVALTIHGMPSVVTQLRSLSPERLTSDASSNQRAKLWWAMGRAIRHFARCGAGAGAHRELYPAFLRSAPGVEYTHGENGYLQVFEECGIVGLGLVAFAIWFLVRCCRQLVRSADVHWRRLSCALIPSLLVCVLHSLIDFVWYLPSCMTMGILVSALIVAARRMASGDSARRMTISRTGWACAAAAAGALGIASCGVLLDAARASPHWDNYLTLSLASKSGSPRSVRQGRLRYMGDVNTDSPEVVDRMISELRNLLDCDSHDSRTHARLASLYLQKFDIGQKESDNPMGLNQIREAAYASQFSSPQRLRDWLETAFGECVELLYLAKRHARRAVELCPLHGEAYLFLAELMFLESPQRRDAIEYLSQARLIRPADGAILIAAGQERALAGDLENAFRCWRRAFRLGPDYRANLISSLALHIPATTIVEKLRPDQDGMTELFRFYKQHRRKDELQVVGTILIRGLITRMQSDEIGEVDAVVAWGNEALSQLEDPQLACEFYRAIVQRFPYDYEPRRMLSHALIAAERYDEAVVELRWCQRKQPGDQRVADALHAALSRQFR
jgi:tetratricopeptide (TPR) repeat protein